MRVHKDEKYTQEISQHQICRNTCMSTNQEEQCLFDYTGPSKSTQYQLLCLKIENNKTSACILVFSNRKQIYKCLYLVFTKTKENQRTWILVLTNRKQIDKQYLYLVFTNGKQIHKQLYLVFTNRKNKQVPVSWCLQIENNQRTTCILVLTN